MTTAPAFRFHHISLSVADLTRQEAWYRTALGLTTVDERLDLPEAGVRTAVLSDGAGLRVEFTERPASEPVVHADPVSSPHPASLRVCGTRISTIPRAICSN